MINVRRALGALGDLYGELVHRIGAGWHYRKARTFQDLLGIQIEDVLYGRDREFEPGRWQQLTTELALLRCGLFVTGSSVGGADRTGHLLRPAICGFADDDVKKWLTEVTAGTHFEVTANAVHTGSWKTASGGLWAGPVWCLDSHAGQDPGCENQDECIGLVTARQITIGQQQRARDIFRNYPVPRAVRGELTGRWQISVYSNKWGDDTLFPVLLDAALARQDAVGAAGKGGPA